MMDIYTQGIEDSKRTLAEEMLRATFLLSLKVHGEVSFQHTDALTAEVSVSVPKLNGELKVTPSDLLQQMGMTLCSMVEGKVVESRMRDTRNLWRRTPGK